MRLTTSDTGAALSSIDYDPWGQVERGAVARFGFTGELQQGSSVHLRARWYNASSGSFASVDPYAGDPASPASLAPYMYAYNQPTLLVDPSGRYVVDEDGNHTDCHQETAYCLSSSGTKDNSVALAGGVAYTGVTTRLYPNTGPTQPLARRNIPGPEIAPNPIWSILGRVCFFTFIASILSGDSPVNSNETSVVYYYVTASESARSIISEGIKPSVGGSSTNDERFFAVTMDPRYTPTTTYSEFKDMMSEIIDQLKDRNVTDYKMVRIILPKNVVQKLEEQGLLHYGPFYPNSIGGYKESIFETGSFSIINQYKASWEILDGFIL